MLALLHGGIPCQRAETSGNAVVYVMLCFRCLKEEEEKGDWLDWTAFKRENEEDFLTSFNTKTRSIRERMNKWRQAHAHWWAGKKFKIFFMDNTLQIRGLSFIGKRIYAAVIPHRFTIRPLTGFSVSHVQHRYDIASCIAIKLYSVTKIFNWHPA